MGFEFDKKKITDVREALNGTPKDIKANIDLLAKAYKVETGRDVCRSCPSDVQYMILSLKNIYKMTQFRFKRDVARYKNKQGDKECIYNGNLTDEKAIEFLKTNPERISLFSKYPSNWEQMLIDGVDSETEEEKEARLAAEAEAEALKNSKTGQGSGEGNEGGSDEETEEEKAARLAAEEEARKAAEGDGNKGNEEKPKREDLMKMQLKELRAKYPDIKANSIKDFVDKVLAE